MNQQEKEEKQKAFQSYILQKKIEYRILYDRMLQAYDIYNICDCNKCANKYLMFSKYVWEQLGRIETQIDFVKSRLFDNTDNIPKKIGGRDEDVIRSGNNNSPPAPPPQQGGIYRI